MFQIVRKVYYLGEVPIGYARAWHDWTRHQDVCYPVGVHWVVRWARSFWHWTRGVDWRLQQEACLWEARYKAGYKAGMEAGVEAGRRSGQARDAGEQRRAELMRYRLKSDHSVECEANRRLSYSGSGLLIWAVHRGGQEPEALTSCEFENRWEPVPEEKPASPLTVDPLTGNVGIGTTKQSPSLIEEELDKAASLLVCGDHWLHLNRSDLERRAAAEIRRLKAEVESLSISLAVAIAGKANNSKPLDSECSKGCDPKKEDGDLIGVKVVMPDGGEGTIAGFSVTGRCRRREYLVLYWYGGNRHETWMERWEFQVKE